MFPLSGGQAPLQEYVSEISGMTLKVHEAFVAPGRQIGDIEVAVADLHANVGVRWERGKPFQKLVSHH